MPSGVYLHKKTQGMFGKEHTEESKEKMSITHGNISDKTREKMELAKLGKVGCNKGKHWKVSEEKLKNFGMKGENHWKWIKDRTKVKGYWLERNNPEYKQWVKKVKKRDNNTCRLKDENCFGYNIAHHIKNWLEYLKLRYKVKNGVTLCQAHHPRTRAEEKRLEPLFEALVAVSSE